MAKKSISEISVVILFGLVQYIVPGVALAFYVIIIIRMIN